MFRLVLVGTVLLTVAVATILVLAACASARRSGLAQAERRRLALRLAGGLAGWLGLAAGLAAAGVLSDFEARPPRMVLLLAGTLVLFTVATSRPAAARLIAAAPRHWPIGLQAMRVAIELGLWGLFAAGKLPVQMTFEGRNIDIVVGLTAPIVAAGVARGWIGTRGAVAWNVASLGILANIIGIAVTTLPGPLHLDWPGISNMIVTTPPFVWIPTFFVPVALFGHVISLRQLLGRRVAPARAAEAVRA
jgi:hypothetical protein